MARRTGYRAPAWLTSTIVVVVLLVWAAAVVVTLLDPTRSIPALLNTVFLSVLGIVFGVQMGLLGGGGGDDDGDQPGGSGAGGGAGNPQP